jgi:hypothetical protein
MASSKATVNIDVLDAAACAYADTVNSEPEDARARMDLAWCTFVQAIWKAAREHASDPVQDDRRSETLLRECLCHAITAESSSADPDMLTEALRIRTLLWCVGRDDLVCDVEAQVSSATDELVRNVMETPKPHQA